MPLPYLDERVEHVGITKLRELNTEKLRAEKDRLLVICDNGQRLAVLVPWEVYMRLQVAAGITSPFKEATPND